MDKKNTSIGKSEEDMLSSKPSSDKGSADQKSKVENEANKKEASDSKSAEQKKQKEAKSDNMEKKSDSGITKTTKLDNSEKSEIAKKSSDKEMAQKKATEPLSDKASPKKKVAESSSDKKEDSKKQLTKSSNDKEASHQKTEPKMVDENSSDKKNTSQEQESESSSEKISKAAITSHAKKEEVKLSGLYAFKLAMSSLYDEKGQVVPVTFLQVKPWLVSQVKKKEIDGYNSVQVACMPQKNNRCSKALKKHLSFAGFSDGARYVKEIRQNSVDNIEVGQPVSIHSIQKGDKVKLQATSKGHGFAGVVKRWGFKGGPASHGSKTHRTSGSIGNRTEPARVMPGKKMAGHYGVEKVSLKNVQIVDVISDENLIVVKGPVPGARNSLVFLSKPKGF
ncbi:MAG: 50S ribosomal protein L3 [Bdellovibrionales bacterium]|nr:50S ribosomal protein L3 [Bdellovibrionales bacterium]